ncbi:hypothetical protein [Sphingobium lactosutens]|uniref:Uncharacterized protein n=1 Tax=Sphingobium lactosutens DS20 TaxID=1331060 RepID=T0HA90_9SPHN|nr:hypothetical protein [Sphingobium lactosutens]EQB13241.1 hypothetical protein RLDS_15985 [Sphingobium lactosutens DS20]
MRVDLLARLEADDALNAAQSISWVSRPPKAGLPGITLQQISPGRAYAMSSAIDLHDSIVRFDFWGLAMRDIDPLTRATVALLEQPGQYGDTIFSRSLLESERDMPAEEVDGIGTVFRISADFRIWWTSTQ